ncbi:glycosyltransferase family 25 protein [Eikenella corrodens]|uniref:glycosyltransferase family 25 protein n=1 Tax=Eikenella corrodens TaxID=539 RepID=UPI00129B8631|nr:glycosyltransferase family 25 protein [Eikenella corrodens]
MQYNYVISLSKAKSRQAHIQQEFGYQNIPFQFFNAITPSDLTTILPDLLPKLQESYLSQMEKACFASHISLWQHCIIKNLPYITIFEDDIFLGKNANAFLANSTWLENLHPYHHPFIIHLETVHQPCQFTKTSFPSYAGRSLFRLRSPHYGAGAYILSQAAVHWLLTYLHDLPNQDFDPIDAILFDTLIYNRYLFTYQIYPALCIQDIILHTKSEQLFGSQMEEERAQNKKPKIQRNIQHKIKREFDRIARKYHSFIYRRIPYESIYFE